jgi:hypothetical protein
MEATGTITVTGTEVTEAMAMDAIEATESQTTAGRPLFAQHDPEPSPPSGRDVDSPADLPRPKVPPTGAKQFIGLVSCGAMLTGAP